MKFFDILKNKKLFFFKVFLTLYIVINLTGGERGLISYFEKKDYEKKLFIKKKELKNKLVYLDSNVFLFSIYTDIDYIDTLYRTKLKFGTKDEILIRLK